MKAKSEIKDYPDVIKYLCKRVVEGTRWSSFDTSEGERIEGFFVIEKGTYCPLASMCFDVDEMQILKEIAGLK